MTTEDLLYSAFKHDNLEEFANVFKRAELKLLLHEFAKGKYRTKDYDKFCNVSAEFIADRIKRIHHLPFVTRFYKCYIMEVFIGLVLLALHTTGNGVCCGYDIFQETEVKSLQCKLIHGKDKKREIRYYDTSLISFLAMLDYANAVDYVLNEITKVFCAANNKCYADRIREDINYISYGTNQQNLFEVSVIFGSLTTVIMLMNRYKPVIRRDINIIIKDSLFADKEKLHRLIYTYRSLYTLTAYRKGNNIKYYSLLCSDPDCDNSECEKIKCRNVKERKKLIYSRKDCERLYEEYINCVKNMYS